LNNFERLLMQLTQHELNGQAEFLSDSSFRLKSSPFQGDIPLGLYELSRRSGKAHHYRLSHPLAECILTQAKSRELTPAEVRFDLSGHAGKISILEPFMNQAGYLTLSLFTVEAPDQAEDYLILAAVTDAGQKLKEEAVRRVFSLSAKVFQSLDSIPEPNGLAELTRQRQDEI
jgi:adenine-specific DNA-methyltransferase